MLVVDDQSQLDNAVLEFLLGLCLGKHICPLVCTWAGLQLDFPRLNLLSDKVILNVNVFGALVVNWVVSQKNARLVVLKDDGSTLLLVTQICK